MPGATVPAVTPPQARAAPASNLPAVGNGLDATAPDLAEKCLARTGSVRVPRRPTVRCAGQASATEKHHGLHLGVPWNRPIHSPLAKPRAHFRFETSKKHDQQPRTAADKGDVRRERMVQRVAITHLRSMSQHVNSFMTHPPKGAVRVSSRPGSTSPQTEIDQRNHSIRLERAERARLPDIGFVGQFAHSDLLSTADSSIMITIWLLAPDRTPAWPAAGQSW